MEDFWCALCDSKFEVMSFTVVYSKILVSMKKCRNIAFQHTKFNENNKPIFTTQPIFSRYFFIDWNKSVPGKNTLLSWFEESWRLKPPGPVETPKNTHVIWHTVRKKFLLYSVKWAVGSVRNNNCQQNKLIFREIFPCGYFKKRTLS